MLRAWGDDILLLHYSPFETRRLHYHAKERTMPHTHLSPSKSRRDLAASLRGSRPRKQARLRHRLLQAEHLEDRQMLATISGTVFNDLNADGVKNTGESGQSGWTVYLDADGNGQLDTGETTATTAADGSYSFGGLAAGTYAVAEVQRPGWQQTSPAGNVPAIERVSVADDSTQGNGDSLGASVISADGRYVAFASSASNLVPGDTNGVQDIFVYDRQADTIERVSVADDGTQGTSQSYLGSISADGRYVAFMTSSSELVSGDTNGTYDIFVYDRQMDTIERVSVAADGTQGNALSMSPSISADGRYVAFESVASNLIPSDTNGQRDVFVYDRQADTIDLVSGAVGGEQGNSSSQNGDISADGRYVAFNSSASNLVPGDTNGVGDSFVFDRQTGTIECISVANDGTAGNGSSYIYSISADGQFVGFRSEASNLVSGDTNGFVDVFVYDRQMDTIERVSVATDGTQGNNQSNDASLSADGRYVAFSSSATNFHPNTFWYGGVFVYDRQTDTIERVSDAADGTQGDYGGLSPSISADGRYVSFGSNSTNLVSGDTNGKGDIFVTANSFAWASGSHVVVLAADQDVSGVTFGNRSPTKFYVVNDATQNLIYEYHVGGTSVESYSLNSGNTAPRGAASTVAGDKTWVVDANRKVYVYNNSGTLLGSWTAGTLSTKAKVEGIATNGTDVWIVDAYSDKVYKYAGGAARLSGTWTASSFSLNYANTSPKDIVTDGVNLWVVNDSTTDKVFKYALSGSLLGSWTISTPGATSPTGITIDPSNGSQNIWIVDSGTDKVYEYIAARSRISLSVSAAFVFALAPGNTNPQGIADPPAPSSLLVAEAPVASEPVSAEAALRVSDAALENMYYEPLQKLRVDTARRSESRTVESSTRDLSYSVGASALAEPVAHRIANANVAYDRHHMGVDDLFAQWESDPLELLSLPDREVESAK